MKCPHCHDEITDLSLARCLTCGTSLDDSVTFSFTAVPPQRPGVGFAKGSTVLLLGFIAMMVVFIFTTGSLPPLTLLIFLIPIVLGIAAVLILAIILLFRSLRFFLQRFKNRNIGIGCVIVIFAALTFFIHNSPRDLYDDYIASSLTVTKTNKTTITAHFKESIGKDKNVVYCASFQKAWDRLQDGTFKGNILLASHPVTARELNKQLLRPEDLAAESYVAEAGPWTSELVARINHELREKFGDEASGYSISSPPGPGDRNLLAYAFLYKRLEFPTKFEKINNPIKFAHDGMQTPVKAFGVESLSFGKERDEKLSAQVTVLYYKNRDDFALSFTSKSPDDEIILAKVSPASTLLETYQRVSTGHDPAPTHLEYGETLRVPKLDFDLTHHFSELENRDILNEGWKNWIIKDAEQQIMFKLDEKGAILKSRSFLHAAMKAEAPAPTREPRQFIFDKPFLIVLKQKNGHLPYFCMWVNNAELLVKE